jgi:hypothetical protein
VLFRRLPRLRWRPERDEQIVSLATQAEFLEFGEDFATLERELLPHFRILDEEALRRQNQYRVGQVVLIFGGAIAVIFGAIQVALPTASWPGVVEFLVAGGLSAVAFRQRELRVRDRYSASRLKAEALRGEYFLFLGHVGAYGHERQRVRHLISRIGQIMAEQ